MPSIPHVPGPWMVAIDEPYDATRPTHILEDGAGHQLALIARLPEVGPEQHTSNLRLIAASPELLAALDAALEQTGDGLHSPSCDVPDCWVKLAETAIAKAKGGAS